MSSDRAAERARVFGIAAHAGFGEAWGRYPDDFGPAYEHDEALFLAIMEAAFAKLHAAGFAVVPVKATTHTLVMGWDALNSGRVRRLPWGPGPGLDAAYPAMVRAADLARDPQETER